MKKVVRQEYDIGEEVFLEKYLERMKRFRSLKQEKR